jgi:branched-chain amino acid transport system substrate-binding protein
MASDEREHTGLPDDLRSAVETPMSRRNFLKVAGATGAVVAASGGLSGVLAACGSSGGSSSNSGETGRTIKVGFVTPLTGPLAAFGEADNFCVSQWKAAVKNGIKCADGKTHPIEIIVKDSQSDSNRAATVAGDLITNDGVDVMMVASTPDTVNPVADQAEALGVPCVSDDCPWESYYFGRGATPAKPFKWTYHAFWGLEDVAPVFMGMWAQIPTNKVVAEMWPNDADGLAHANPKTGMPPFLTKGGYKIVDGGRYQDGTQDFTAQITKFKSANCQILNGVMIPPDFTNFWKQSYQQGFKPKTAAVGKALLFPSALEALGNIGYGLDTEVWWSPVHPFTSSLSGQTCQQFADAYTAASGKEWTQPLMHYQVFEVVADALKRTTNVDDKESILTAIIATDLNTIAGRVTWKAGAPLNPVKNVCRTPLVGGQWQKGTKYQYELVVVDNSHAKEAPFSVTIPTNGKVTPLTYGA